MSAMLQQSGMRTAASVRPGFGWTIRGRGFGVASCVRRAEDHRRTNGFEHELDCGLYPCAKAPEILTEVVNSP